MVILPLSFSPGSPEQIYNIYPTFPHYCKGLYLPLVGTPSYSCSQQNPNKKIYLGNFSVIVNSWIFKARYRYHT